MVLSRSVGPNDQRHFFRTSRLAEPLTMVHMIVQQQRRLVPLLRRFSRSCYLLRSFSSGEGDPYASFRAQMKELQEEREFLYGFTDEDVTAWKQQGSSPLDSAQIDLLNQARMQQNISIDHQYEETPPPHFTTSSQQPFTHLSADGADIAMVDVGHKDVTHRVARAQSRVVFPPEVMSAFEVVGGELIGPKGPIFTTAKLAGIMAAKRTSDLIPLCHPLPLDKVHVEIHLEGNVATIECECRVTHKTGVEMEALTGASIAALTIYDMVKAVSHRVEITQTTLLTKSGGKRTINNE